jgi:hypothetical protein
MRGYPMTCTQQGDEMPFYRIPQAWTLPSDNVSPLRSV